MAVRAFLPTTTSDSLKKTTLGVMNSPSALGTIALRPDSSTQAMAELVVPRSIPIGLSWGISGKIGGPVAVVEGLQHSFNYRNSRILKPVVRRNANAIRQIRAVTRKSDDRTTLELRLLSGST